MAQEQDETQRRILMVAAPLFAERGFHGVTVRDIVGAAGVNLAAVNYYFGGKEGLYLAVLEHHALLALERYPLPESGRGDPEARFAAFVGGFLHRLLDPASPSLIARLMAREIASPTVALERVVDLFTRPQMAHLMGVLAELTGRGPQDPVLRACLRSVVGQCLFYHLARPVLAKVEPGLSYDEATIAALTDHVVRFSLAGIAAATRGRA